jgi:hypothetical protein
MARCGDRSQRKGEYVERMIKMEVEPSARFAYKQALENEWGVWMNEKMDEAYEHID